MSSMYTFSELGNNGVTTTVSFNLPHGVVTAYTFHSMCITAAKAFGWCDDTVRDCLGEVNDLAYQEFGSDDDDD